MRAMMIWPDTFMDELMALFVATPCVGLTLLATLACGATGRDVKTVLERSFYGLLGMTLSIGVTAMYIHGLWSHRSAEPSLMPVIGADLVSAMFAVAIFNHLRGNRPPAR